MQVAPCTESVTPSLKELQERKKAAEASKSALKTKVRPVTMFLSDILQPLHILKVRSARGSVLDELFTWKEISRLLLRTVVRRSAYASINLMWQTKKHTLDVA
jgi:hypothetical protein